MEKEKEATKDVAKEKKDNLVSIADCYALNQAIYDLSASCPTMKGKIVFSLAKNEGKLESVLKKADKKQTEIINKYVKIDKNGDYVLTKPTDEEIGKGARPEYIYKSKEGKASAEKEIKAYFESEVEVDFHKIWMNDFENLDISPARNTRIGLFIEYLVTEIRDLRAMN